MDYDDAAACMSQPLRFRRDYDSEPEAALEYDSAMIKEIPAPIVESEPVDDYDKAIIVIRPGRPRKLMMDRQGPHGRGMGPGGGYGCQMSQMGPE